MRRSTILCRANARRARSIWGQLSSHTLYVLKQLTINLYLSVAAGDLQLLENRWYITHSGLLRIAQRRRCYGIKTVLVDSVCDPVANRWVFSATVYNNQFSK